MKSFKNIFILTILLCTSCATVAVKPVDETEDKISTVCIKENPKVIVRGFTDVIEEGFARHNISTKFYAEIPSTCKYSLTYVATQKWDVTLFLSNAHIALYKKDVLIGYADFHTIGGLDPAKWNSVHEKIDPLIDQLLANVSRDKN